MEKNKNLRLSIDGKVIGHAKECVINPYENKTIEQLKKLLKIAEQCEDYLLCAKLRDIIYQREGGGRKKSPSS